MDSKDSLSNKHLVAIIAIVAIAVVGIVGLVLGMFGISKNNMILSKDLAGQAVIPAGTVSVNMVYSANVPEMQGTMALDNARDYVPPASGFAVVNVGAGTARIRVRHLPPLPAMLTDFRTGTKKLATSYQAWLIRVDRMPDGHFVINEGVNLGVVRVGAHGEGLLQYRNHGLAGYSFNVVAVTAETGPGPRVWSPEDPASRSFTWVGLNGIIVIWSELMEPLD